MRPSTACLHQRPTRILDFFLHAFRRLLRIKVLSVPSVCFNVRVLASVISIEPQGTVKAKSANLFPEQVLACWEYTPRPPRGSIVLAGCAENNREFYYHFLSVCHPRIRL